MAPVIRCPKCHVEVDSLNYDESGLLVRRGDGWVKDDNPSVEVRCPECGEQVAIDEMEVEE